MRGDLAQVVRECLQETGIDPSLLELELSERGVLRSDPEILRQLHAIRALGVRLAIDDFGTGNSAVAYLKQFPIDVLKIDQSFVRGVASSPEDAAITSATIAMARQLGLRVVAEGVEEQGQMDFLQPPRLQRVPGLPVLAGRPSRRVCRACCDTGSTRLSRHEVMRAKAHEAETRSSPCCAAALAGACWRLAAAAPSGRSASTASPWSRGCPSPR